MKTDEFGERLAANLNRLPAEGGRVVKARYIPHLQRLMMETHDSDALAILEDNKRLYKERHKQYGSRRDMAGGYPLRFPQQHLEVIKQHYPEARTDAPPEDRKKFYESVYKHCPWYRIG